MSVYIRDLPPEPQRIVAIDSHGETLLYAKGPRTGSRWVVHLEGCGLFNFFVDDETTARGLVRFIGDLLDRQKS
ncbi:hypothetical protein TIMSHEL_61 [Mycobacterium phage Timshel]|uniref:Uncharacterized protein n=1 Tax=Mycobacterium phage Timshel TaxID=1032895 RepID=G1DB79_9CAUD|nr:hypothetical protein FDI10_gp33 [Mycobacterium phage Timshel]AEJ92373.1 hypothetical protein TIMSHEL_61 [Mycobacterium phage Timshel]